MKTAETKTASTSHLHQTGQPFFQKNGESAFFSDRQADLQTKPFFSKQKTSPFIQTKLTIGRPGDKYEQEADAMADRVVQRLSNPETIQTKSKPLNSLTNSITPLVQPKCAGCEEEEQLQKKEEDKDRLEQGIQLKPVFESDEPPPEEEEIQRKCAECLSAEASAKQGEAEGKLQKKEESGSSEAAITSSMESRLNSSRGSGNPLPEDTRTQMESSFGADFSNVRIHTGINAEQMNQDLHAQAFTHGSDIYFNSGNYKPQTTEGKQLLAHELTHTIQQGASAGLTRSKAKALQRKPIGEEVQDKLREENKTVTTEAPIPGAAPRGITDIGDTVAFNRMGFADLYKAEPGEISGIRGIAVDEISAGADAGKKKYTYGNIRATDVDQTKGPKKQSPTLNGGKYARFLVDGAGVSKHYNGAKSLNGNFPATIQIGEIKGKDVITDNPLLAPRQVNDYRRGMSKFISSAQRDFGAHVQKPTFSELTGLTIPEGLDYKDFERQRNTTGKGHIVRGSRRVWLGEIENTGIYLWARLPHPFDIPADVAREQHEAITKLRQDVLEEFKKVKQKRTSGSLVSKKEAPGEKNSGNNEQAEKGNEVRDNSNVKGQQHLPKSGTGKMVQRKTDWTAARKNFNDSLDAWKKTQGKPFLKDKQVEQFLEEKVEFDERLNKRTGSTGKINEAVKEYKIIDFWASPKGLVIGNLRFLLGEKFDWLAEKVEGLKERTRQVKAKAGALKPSGFSKGWMAKIVKLLLKGFKVGFEQFMDFSFSVFAECISAVIAKFEEQMRQQLLEGLVDEELEAKLNELKTELEALLAELETKYAEQLAIYESLLEKMNDAAHYTSIITTAVNLIRTGVQVVSCFTPPGLGCLWGLAANIGIEVALNLVVGTEWFEDKFMKPLVKDLMEGFVKDTLLKFLNEMFALVGLEDYVEGIETCTPQGDRVQTTRLYRPDKGLIITPDLYEAYAKVWEAKNKSVLMKEVVEASDGTATKDDIERLLKQVKEENISSEEFAQKVAVGKKGENKFDFGKIAEQIPGLKGNGGEENVRVVNGNDSPMKDSPGEGKAGTIRVENASPAHVKGSNQLLTLLCTSIHGDHTIITNVEVKVMHRYYYNSSKGEREDSRSGADMMQVVYKVTNTDGYTIPFDENTGVLPPGKEFRGYFNL